MRYLVLSGCIFFAASAFAQSADDPNYSGTWRLHSDDAVRLVLTQKDDTIHVKELRGTEIKADYTCNTVGKECTVKYEGRPAKVSFWFNGPKLVEFETRGGTVTRRRFQLADNGSTLNIELSSLSPGGKDEKLEFARIQ